MQTNERVVTRRQALGLALKALAVVVPVAAVIASGAKYSSGRADRMASPLAPSLVVVDRGRLAGNCATHRGCDESPITADV